MRDPSGAVLWRHVFDDPATRYWETTDAQHSGQLPLLTDFDGDGRIEFLFRQAYPIGDSASDSLYCFEAGGPVRWRYQSLRTVHSGKPESFPPPNNVRAFTPVRLGAGRRGIVVSTTNNLMYSARVVLLSPIGAELAEYWHSGHLPHIRALDRNGDGRDEVYLTGVSNSYRQATLVVLDPTSMAGASLESNPDYQLQGFPQPVELARLLFTRSQVSLNSSLNYNFAALLYTSGSDLTVDVLENHRLGQEAVVIYRLDRALQPLSVSAGDSLMHQHQTLLESGMTRLTLDAQLAALQKGVTYLTPLRQ